MKFPSFRVKESQDGITKNDFLKAAEECKKKAIPIDKFMGYMLKIVCG